LNPRPVNRKSNALPLSHHASFVNSVTHVRICVYPKFTNRNWRMNFRKYHVGAEPRLRHAKRCPEAAASRQGSCLSDYIFVRPFVSTLSFEPRLTFQLEFLYVCGSWP